jgi:hypothetical protein
MISGWMLIWLLIAQCALPLLAVGVILRLVEASWGKRCGELGSMRVLLGACLFFLPLALYFLVGILRVEMEP